MKLVVISDTHGKSHRIAEVLKMHVKYDWLLFLGDGLRDFDWDTGCFPVAVSGNCDMMSFVGGEDIAPTERMINVGGVRILMMHGHEKDVKSGVERAVAYAASREADLLLFGHTHVAYQKYFPEDTEVCGNHLSKPIWVFNPGSLGRPNDGAPSFGVIEIKKGQILLSHGYLRDQR